MLAHPVNRSNERLDRSRLSRSLLEQARDGADEETRQQLLAEVVHLNIEVAESVARRYRNRGISDEDLRQVAAEALVRAVNSFDPDRDSDLLSYAVPSIRGTVLRHFRDCGWMVRPPRSIQENQQLINRTVTELAQELGRPPERREVLDRLDMTDRTYTEAMTAAGCFHPASLDGTRPDSDTPLGNLLPDTNDDRPAAEARAMLGPVLRKLDERERRILYLRFFEGRTQHQIGSEIGLTQTQVSRLLKATLAQLRQGLGGSLLESA